MSIANYKIKYEPPTVADFIAIRALIGWGQTNTDMAKVSLANSLFHVTIYQQSDAETSETLIGMGRVVGDGAMYFYIQDVVVASNVQGQGFGKLLMAEIEDYLTQAAKKGATIGLLAAKGKEGFYKNFGYQNRPSGSLGNGMCKFVN